MTDIPLFSVIVPVYKVEKYLNQCIDSLLDQKYDSYEIILVDDGSPDRCPAICDEYARKYAKVKVVHKPNGGLSDARNAGVAAATGLYITFADSDDFWKDADVFSGVAEVINENHYPDVIVSDMIKYYDDTDKYKMPPLISNRAMNGAIKIKILNYFYLQHADMKMSACQKFVKRKLLSDIPFTKDLLSEDIDWSLKLYPVVTNICVYDKPFYCYRQNREGSITNTASQKSFDSLVQILDKWSMQIPELNISDEEKEIYFGYLAYQLSIAIMLLSNTDSGKRKDNIEALKKHLKLFSYPVNFKTTKVKLLIKILGISLTSRLLKFYIQNR